MDKPRGFGLYIKHINACMDSEANRHLSARNLTRSQSHFLMELLKRPDHTAALKEMEICLNAAQSTVAGLAQRLEKKGLIESLQSPEDHRVKLVRLTDEGVGTCEVSFQEIAASEAHLVSSLTDCEQMLLLNLLERMYKTVVRTTHE